jgi:hypothetical protein
VRCTNRALPKHWANTLILVRLLCVALISAIELSGLVLCSVDGVQPAGLPASFRVVPAAMDAALSKIRPEIDEFRVTAGDLLRLSVISFDRCCTMLTSSLHWLHALRFTML